MTSLNRRDMLRVLAAGVASSVAARALFPEELAAMSRSYDDDDSGAVWPFKKRIKKVGLQLYTVRNAMTKDQEATLAQVAAAGVKEVEFAGYFSKTPAQWVDLLNKYGLSSPSTHIGFPATDEAWKPLFDNAKAIGHKWVIVPSVGNNYRGSVDGFKRLADRLNASGTLAKQSGLRIGYHNHDFEFAPVGNTTGFDVMMSNTDPALVDMELDLYWAVKAGQDPLAMIDRWPGRFKLCHVKDAGPLPDRKMMDVGAGTIDFAKIFKKAKRAGFEHYFIEHDQPEDAAASVKASAAYLAKLRF